MLTLLPKKGGPPRPKELTPNFASQHRLQSYSESHFALKFMLVDIIHPNQAYTIPGRTIFDNLCQVLDLFHLACRDGLLLILLSLDPLTG